MFTYVSKCITVLNLNLHSITVTFIHQSFTNTSTIYNRQDYNSKKMVNGN